MKREDRLTWNGPCFVLGIVLVGVINSFVALCGSSTALHFGVELCSGAFYFDFKKHHIAILNPLKSSIILPL